MKTTNLTTTSAWVRDFCCAVPFAVLGILGMACCFGVTLPWQLWAVIGMLCRQSMIAIRSPTIHKALMR